MKFNTNYIPIVVGASLAIGVLVGSYLPTANTNSFATQNNSKNKLYKLIDLINNEYVDSVNTDSIVNLTVDKILSQLDPHSVYISPAEHSQVAESMKGDFVGIGVNFYMYKDSLAVIKPVENGPSAKAGILPGDRILYAGKTKLFGRNLPTDSLFSQLKGTKGSQVELTLYRKSADKKLKVKLKRDIIPIKSVDVALLLTKEVGYVKINRFAETTYEEFKNALSQLKKYKVKALVIDLRDNGGGYMEEAIAIADEFLKENQLIVYTKNKNGTEEKTFATKEGAFEEGKVYVLIDENSASASEVLAGALQDNDRGIIVGRRSFGKGLVQREMDFKDGSAVRLTVARYYTPTGRSIQKPYSHGNSDYYKESDARFKSGELYEKDSIKVADSLKFKTPKGKIVYGGGGIVPDVFVPIEVEKGNENVAFLLQSGLIGRFVFEILDKDRSEFKGLSFPDFRKKMNASDAYYNLFQQYIYNAGFDVPFKNNKNLVNRFITAEFARQLYGENYFYLCTLGEDPMIKAVLKQK